MSNTIITSLVTALLTTVVLMLISRFVSQKKYSNSKALNYSVGDFFSYDEKYRLLVEKSLDGIVITQDVKFIYINKAFCDMVGYSAQELYSMDPVQILSPEEKDRVMSMYYRRMAGTADAERYSSVFIKKNGEPIQVDMSSTTIDFKGKKASYVTVRDVSTISKLQKSLKETEVKYRELVEKALDGINITQDGILKYVNPAFCEIVGYSKEELLGTKAVNYISSEFHENLQKMHQRRMSGEHFTTIYSCEALTKEGNRKRIELNVTTVEFEGRPAAFIITRDITERIKLEQSIKESEEFHRLLVNGINDGIFDWKVKEGTVSFSRRYKELLGYSEDEFSNNLEEWSSRLHPEDIEWVMKRNQDYINGKTDRYEAEYRLKHKNGEYRWILARGYCLRFPSGEAYRMIGTHIDVTERHALQEALEMSMQRYRDLAEMLPQTIYELDVNGNITYINQVGIKVFGYQSTTGRSAFDFIAPEDHARMKENMSKSFTENRQSRGNEYTAIKENGERFPVMVYAAPMYSKGKVIGTRGMIVDITDRKSIENALRESESKYKTLIENSQDGIFAISGDKILFANNTFCKMLGYKPEELYQKSAASLLYPDDLNRGLALSDRRKAGDRSTLNELFRFVANDGSVKEGDVFSSVVELNGQVVSLITVHDLTESKRLQMVLKESEEKYRQLFTAESDAIFMIDAETGQILDANPAAEKIYGYSHDELITMKNTDVSAEPEKTTTATRNQQTLVPLRFHRKKDGTVFPVELSAGFTILNKQKIQIVTSRDITLRMKADEELRKAKVDLELLNKDLEQRIEESSQKLTEARTQLINLQKENLQSQFDVLKQQVNPHFLFNSLNVLTSLIKLEPDLAEKFSEQLSKVYRYVLENKDNELVSLKTELEFLKAYIFLLDIRFVEKLRVNINIPDNRLDEMIIPLAMQLIIENAIKHNTMSKKEPLIIDIFIDIENRLNIINNLQERESQIISTGVGLKNIQNRYLLLNNTQPEFEKTKKQFIARIPMIREPKA